MSEHERPIERRIRRPRRPYVVYECWTERPIKLRLDEILCAGAINLYFIDFFTDYAFWLVMPFLTSVWRLSFVDAAVITNLSRGAAEVLAMGIFWLADSLLGHFLTILISTLSSFLGLGFLILSAGVFSQCFPECLATQHKAFLYTGLSLTSLAVSGYKASKDTFLEEQFEDIEHSERPLAWGYNLFSYCTIGAVIITVAGALAIGYFEPGPIAFGVALVPTVFVAADFLTFVSRDNVDVLRGCVLGSIPLMDYAINFFPLFSTLIVGGLVSSIGNSYFIEQASRLSSRIGPIPIPLTLLKFFYWFTERLVCGMCRKFQKQRPDDDVSPQGFLASMVASILCCATAAVVEVWRLQVVRTHGLIYKPDETVPLTLLCILPQYIFLAAMNEILTKSVDYFIEHRFRGERHYKRYVVYFAKSLFGLGIIGSALSVYVTNVATAKDGKTGWFGETLNRSRLDNYYWTLALISAANLACLAAPNTYKYCMRKLRGDEREGQEREQLLS